MTKVFVIGNCQAPGLSDWIAAQAPMVTSSSASIAGVPTDRTDITDAWRRTLAEADIVFCQLTDALLAAYGLPSEAEMKATGRPFFRAPVLAFKGFHPDCTYVFTDGHAAPGAMGPYHSAIAVGAFLEGLSAERALGLFNAFTYAALGYFEAYGDGAEAVRQTCLPMGIDLSGLLAQSGTRFMHTINHPANPALAEVARQALGLAGLTPQDAAHQPPDHLDEYEWPVYPHIAARLGGDGDFDFRKRAGGAEVVFTLEEMIAATYASLTEIQAAKGGVVLDQDRPMATPPIERARAFIRRHVVS